LVIGRSRACRNRGGLAVRLGGETGDTDVRDPDLDRSQPLRAQSLTMSADALAGGRGIRLCLDHAAMLHVTPGCRPSAVASAPGGAVAMEKDIRGWVKVWNDNPKPFIWTKTAEEILASLARLLNRTTTSETN
jgi:hypothetical protein